MAKLGTFSASNAKKAWKKLVNVLSSDNFELYALIALGSVMLLMLTAGAVYAAIQYSSFRAVFFVLLGWFIARNIYKDIKKEMESYKKH